MAIRPKPRNSQSKTCEAGPCKVSGNKSCACIYIHGNGYSCEAMISPRRIKHISKGSFRKTQHDLDTEIEFCVKGATLMDVAKLLDRSFPYHGISIPVSKVNKKVSMCIDRKPLGNVIELLGLSKILEPK